MELFTGLTHSSQSSSADTSHQQAVAGALQTLCRRCSDTSVFRTCGHAAWCRPAVTDANSTLYNVWPMWPITRVTSDPHALLHPVFENTYFTFFFQISKNMTFYVFFWNDVSKNVKCHKKYQICWMSVEILAWKFPDVMGRPTYRRLSHTVLSCTVSCVHTSEQDVWCSWLTVTCRYRFPVIE